MGTTFIILCTDCATSTFSKTKTNNRANDIDDQTVFFHEKFKALPQFILLLLRIECIVKFTEPLFLIKFLRRDECQYICVCE